MTRNREKGENEIAAEAKREAARTDKDVCTVLAEMLERAKRDSDRPRQLKIIQAQKFLRCRNQRKRRRQS
jgi:hypothetical protein